MNDNDENMNKPNSDDESIEDIIKQREVLNKTLKKLLIEIEKKKKN